MTYEVLNASKLKDRESQYGQMTDYMLVFKDGSAGEMSQKASTPAPKTGDTLDGTIEDTQYGPKFRKTKQAGGFGGQAYNPEREASIIRQNSLTNAVAYCLGKANLMTKEAGLKWLSGKEVLQVATYFARYSKGAVTVVTEAEKPSETATTANDEPTPLPEPPEGDDISLDDIPF